MQDQFMGIYWTLELVIRQGDDVQFFEHLHLSGCPAAHVKECDYWLLATQLHRVKILQFLAKCPVQPYSVDKIVYELSRHVKHHETFGILYSLLEQEKANAETKFEFIRAVCLFSNFACSSMLSHMDHMDLLVEGCHVDVLIVASEACETREHVEWMMLEKIKNWGDERKHMFVSLLANAAVCRFDDGQFYACVREVAWTTFGVFCFFPDWTRIIQFAVMCHYPTNVLALTNEIRHDLSRDVSKPEHNFAAFIYFIWHITGIHTLTSFPVCNELEQSQMLAALMTVPDTPYGMRAQNVRTMITRHISEVERARCLSTLLVHGQARPTVVGALFPIVFDASSEYHFHTLVMMCNRSTMSPWLLYPTCVLQKLQTQSKHKKNRYFLPPIPHTLVRAIPMVSTWDHNKLKAMALDGAGISQLHYFGCLNMAITMQWHDFVLPWAKHGEYFAAIQPQLLVETMKFHLIHAVRENNFAVLVSMADSMPMLLDRTQSARLMTLALCNARSIGMLDFLKGLLVA